MGEEEYYPEEYEGEEIEYYPERRRRYYPRYYPEEERVPEYIPVREERYYERPRRPMFRNLTKLIMMFLMMYMMMYLIRYMMAIFTEIVHVEQSGTWVEVSPGALAGTVEYVSEWGIA